jgi:putative transposase
LTDYRSILDEVQLRINGRKHWLWRAVDQEGVGLESLVQVRRNQEAAEAFLRHVVTDTLASSPPAVRRGLPHTEHSGTRD